VNPPKIKKCIIIAEAGINHNGQVSIAKKMIREAAKAGADFIKFQTFIPSALVTDSAPKADYQKKALGKQGNQRDMLEKLKLSNKEFVFLRKECQRRKIGFLSTAFDLESLKFIESLQPAFHKISSGDIDNPPFLKQVASYKRPVLLSTGTANLREVSKALQILRKNGLSRKKITVLQCHTDYPTNPSDVNLRVLDTFMKKFKTCVGFSDHTTGIAISLAGVARGAKVIEKHFTLNRCLHGPDHQASITPYEFKKLVEEIRSVEEALGKPEKTPSKKEKKIIKNCRKFLVASKKINKGEMLSQNNVALKRCQGILPASKYYSIIGKRAKKTFVFDEPLQD